MVIVTIYNSITVHRIFTFFSIFPHDRSTEFSLLFLLFPLFFGVISRPIRSRHLYNLPNSHIFSRIFLRNLFVPGQLLENYSSNQITKLASLPNQITTFTKFCRSGGGGGTRGVTDGRFGSRESRLNCLRRLFY